MNAVTTTESTALSLTERVRRAISLKVSEDELKALAARTADITTITNPAGREQVHSARIVLKRQRIDIQTAGEMARADAVAFQKATIIEVQRLVDLVEPEEQRLNDLQIAWDRAREAEKQERAEAERKRIAEIQARLTAIRAWPQSALNQPASLAEQKLRNATDFVAGEDFGEFADEARAAVEASRQQIEQILTERLAHEAEQARIKAEREELERQKAAQEVIAKAERERIAAEEVEAKQRREEERHAHEEQLRLEREEQEAQAAAEREQRRVEREAEEVAAKARQDAIDAENAKEEARLKAEREEREAEDRELQEAQQRNANALQEIQGIQQQVMIASVGRAGVRSGGTIECIVQTLAETEAWPIDGRFGIFKGNAEKAKETAVAQIRTLLQDALERKRQDEEAVIRQAEIDAEIARQTAVLRAQQEQLDAARRQLEQTQRLEAERLAPAPEVVAQPDPPTDDPEPPFMPSAIDIVQILVNEFGVSAGTVLAWLVAVEWAEVEIEGGNHG